MSIIAKFTHVNFKGGQFYGFPCFDDMPVGTVQCILEHYKIGVHGTTGFHFSPSFLTACCFLLAVMKFSLHVKLYFCFFATNTTPPHPPNLSIKNCGLKASFPPCSPWRNKHLVLFCLLPALFLNFGTTAVVSFCPRNRGCSLNNLEKLAGKQRSGLCLALTMQFSLRGFF